MNEAISQISTHLPSLPSFLRPYSLLCASRGETLWMSSLWSAFTGLLSHDQAPADSRWGCALSVHGLPGILQQPGCHAETHQEPRSTGFPRWLEHQQHLPVHIPHLSPGSETPLHLYTVLKGVASICVPFMCQTKHLFLWRIGPRGCLINPTRTRRSLPLTTVLKLE